jgi:hypothetical protein
MYQKIRCNAFKKIASILAESKGVLFCSSHMEIDDSYDTRYSVSSADEALEWLKENQRGARVYMDGNKLVISGPYYFSDHITAYLDEADFIAEAARLVEGFEVAAPVAVEVVNETSAPIVTESPALVAANDASYELVVANDDVYTIERDPEPKKNAPVKKVATGATAIAVLEDGSFYLESRGHKMKLSFDASLNLWEMHTDNASRRAYRGLGLKFFCSLDEIERTYKSWRGVSLLIEGITSNAH